MPSPLSRFPSVLAPAILIAMFLAYSAGATTYYVRMTGADANPGTSPDKAFRKISKAANVMMPGDTVYVGAGTWSDTINPGRDATSGSPIRFIADTDGSQTGDAGAVNTTGEINNSRNYIQFIGLRIYNTGNYGAYFNAALGCLIQDCEIYNNKSAIEVAGYTTLTIQNCNLHNNAERGVYINSGDARTTISVLKCRMQSNTMAGVYVKKAAVTLKNCLITGNAQQGVFADNDAATNVTIWNCTISDNSSDGLLQKGGTVTATNCVLTYNGRYGVELTGGTFNHSYNLAYQNTSGDAYGVSSLGPGDVVANPLFNDRVNGNYLFPKTSPLWNAGTSATGIVDDDLLGRARPAGRTRKWDIGCYELQYGEGGMQKGVRIVRWVEVP